MDAFKCLSAFLHEFKTRNGRSFQNLVKKRSTYIVLDQPVEKKGDEKQSVNIPYKWDEQYANIEKMFKAKDGPPVEMFDINKVIDRNVDSKVFRLQVLIALMLTYRNSPDAVTSAMQRLRKNGCNIKNLRTMPRDDIAASLLPINYYMQRADDIKKLVDVLHEKYEDDIPETLENLCSLSGVKPNIAILTAEYAWQKSEGIAVHLRLHSIANRLGWVRTVSYEDTRNALESFAPREKWKDISKVTYWFGTHICSLRPKCVSCLNRNVCPRMHAKYLDD